MRGYILLSFSPKNHYDHRLQRDGSSSSLVQLVLTQLTNKVTQFLCQQQWLAHYPPARPPKRKSSIRGFLHVRREIRRKKKVVPSSSIYYGIVNNSFSNCVCVENSTNTDGLFPHVAMLSLLRKVTKSIYYCRKQKPLAATPHKFSQGVNLQVKLFVFYFRQNWHTAIIMPAKKLPTIKP